MICYEQSDIARSAQVRGSFGKMIPADHRPSLHLSVRTGWMNDPNGFSYYKGRYHMFYQYYPYDSHWNSMHWGHAVSDDLLHWEYLPAALAPDESYDRDGCFSGNAMTLPDGRQLLMYTGVVQERQKMRRSLTGRTSASQWVTAWIMRNMRTIL